MIFFIIVSLTAFNTITKGQAGNPDNGYDTAIRRELIQLRQTFFDAQKQGNRFLLEQLLADSFYFVHSTGVLTKRKEFIERTVEQAGRQRELEVLDQQLFIYGDNTAVWLTRSVGRSSDGTETNFRATDVLVKIGKQWQWVAVNSTKLSTRPKPAPVAADLLKSYVGKYQINDDKIFIVSEENGILIGQSIGVRQKELIPRSATEFVWFSPDSNADMRISFLKDETGHVTHAVLQSEGKEVWRAKKLN